MDAQEKRVLRRMTTVLVNKLKMTERITVQAYRQGLIDYKALVNLLSMKVNDDRVLFFLLLIERVKPAGFEKFCFFLENHGNTRLCDDLWLELIAEKGQIKIDPDVIEEVRGYIRKKIKEGHLNEEDLEEVIMIAATRCQVKRDAKMKKPGSGTSISSNASGRDTSIFKEVEKLCAEIEECMPGLLDNGDMMTRRPGANNPAFQPLAEHKRSTSIQRWARDLKDKLNIHADDSKIVNAANRPGFNKSYSFTNPVKSGSSRSDGAIPRERTARTRSGHARKKAGYGGQKKRAAGSKNILEGNCENFKNQMEQKKDKTGSSKSSNEKTKSGSSEKTKSTRNEIWENKATRKDKSVKEKKKKKKKKKGQDDDSEEDLSYELPEYRSLTASEEKDIHGELVNLYKRQGIVENVRKAVGEQVSQKMAPRLRMLEQSYWAKRCDVMKRCQATGYYYFLSAHKHQRCQACKGNERPCPNDCCRRQAAPLDANLYKSHSSQPRATKFDDCDCPGAISVPGQPHKRCLACAYANNQSAMLYDAAVTSNGSHHLTFPTLDSVTPMMQTRLPDRPLAS